MNLGLKLSLATAGGGQRMDADAAAYMAPDSDELYAPEGETIETYATPTGQFATTEP